jgi:hypothetical protein
MPIAPSTRGQNVTVSTPQTFSFTNGEASPLLVAVHSDVVAVTGVTFNGVALTDLSNADSSVALTKVRLFGIANPFVGTANIVVTYASAPGGGAVAHVLSTTGGDNTTGFRTAYSRSDVDGTGPGLTVVNSQNGDLVVHAASVYAATITVDGGQDSTGTEDDAIAGSSMSGALSTKAATGANTAVGCTDVTYYGEVAVAVIPAAAGTTQDLAGAATGSGAATGNLNVVTGTITTPPLKNRAGTVIASTTIPKLTWIRLSDFAQQTTWTNQATNGSGVLTLTGAGVVTGVPGLLVISNADGSARGVHLLTPA